MKRYLFSILMMLTLALVSISPIAAQDTNDCESGFRLFTHAMGESCIPKNPARVVVLDTGELDNALALGAPVIGAPVGDALQYQAYLSDQLEGISDTGTISAPNFEAILALSPDLILGSKQRYEAIYEQLTQIAPTVLTASLRVPWQENFQLHADALGKTTEAEQLLADYAAHVAEVQAALGDALDSTTISIIRFRPGQVRLYLKSSYIGYILQDVGLQRPLSQDEDVFSAEISAEEMQAVDADYIFVTGYDVEDSERDAYLNSPLWQTLSAVQAGHVVDINDDTWIAGLGVQAANLVLDDLQQLLATPSAQAASICESGFRLVIDALDTSVCVPESPQRVVALAETDLDAALALGVVPIGTVMSRQGNSVAGYLADLVPGITLVGQIQAPNLEAVAALQPDLILSGLFLQPDQWPLDELRQIAPTVVTSLQPDDWKTSLRGVANALNLEAEVEAWFTSYEARLQEVRAALGDSADAEVSIVRWNPQGPSYMLLQHFASSVLADVGLQRPVSQQQDGLSPSQPLSLEALTELDADWMFVGVLNEDGEAAMQTAVENPLWQTLNVVQQDHVVMVDGVIWTARGGPLAALHVLDDVEAAMRSESAAFPVSLTHSLGTIEIPAQPERVIALGSGDIDTAYGLGVTPVAISINPYRENGLVPWLEDAYDTEQTELLPAGDISFEHIIELRPDVILAGGLYNISQLYPGFSEIAPTTAWLTTPLGDTWQEQTLQAGRALGLEAEAQTLIDETEIQITSVRDEYPAVVGKTFSISYLRGLSSIGSLYSQNDFAVQFFQDVGFILTLALAELSEQEGGVQAELSLETLNLIDADLVVLAFSSPDVQAEFEANPLYQQLPAVQEGRVVVVDLTVITQLRVPSVLGIRWVLEQLEPAFAALN